MVTLGLRQIVAWHPDVELVEWAAQGLTIKEIVERFAAVGCSTCYKTVREVMIDMGIKRRLRGKPKDISEETKSRSAIMAEMFRGGRTMEQIGGHFGVSRERVRQIITKEHGLTREDGGANKRAKDNHEKRKQKRTGRYQKKYGCTIEQFNHLSSVKKKMMAAGAGLYQTPGRAYSTQRRNAKTRNIEWKFNLWGWWQIWEQSGKWNERGRGQGYVMARFNDIGAYEPGNVSIITAIKNISTAPKKKKSDLPCGVHRGRNGGKFYATRMFGGKTYYLGMFPTPEQAGAAYLAFLPPARLGNKRFDIRHEI